MFANFLPFRPPCCLAWGTHSQSTVLVSHIQEPALHSDCTRQFSNQCNIYTEANTVHGNEIITVTVQKHGCTYYTSAQFLFPHRIHTHTRTHTHTHTHTPDMHAHTHAHTDMHAHTHTHMHTRMNTHTTCTLSCFLFCFVFLRTSHRYI